MSEDERKRFENLVWHIHDEFQHNKTVKSENLFDLIIEHLRLHDSEHVMIPQPED